VGTVLSALLAAVVAAALVRALLAKRAGQWRVASFARQWQVSVAEADFDTVSAYLGETRRSGWAGVAAAVPFAAIGGLSGRGTGQSFAIVLCGWLAGMAVAELRTPRLATRALLPVPRVLIWLPRILGAVAVAGTPILWATVDFGLSPRHALVCGFGSAVVSGAASAVVQFRRRYAITVEADVDAALRTQAIANLTGVAVAAAGLMFLLTVAFAVGPADLADNAGRPATNPFWAAAAVVGGAAIASRRWTARPLSVLDRPVTVLGGGVVVLLLASGAVAEHQMWVDRMPFGPAALHASVTARLTDDAHYTVDATAVGDPRLQRPVRPRDRVLVGHLDYTVPAGTHPRGEFYFVLIDQRSNTDITELDGTSGSGWGGFGVDALTDRYPWLSALRLTPDDLGGLSSDANAIMWEAGTPGPRPFVAAVPLNGGVSLDDLMAAVIYIGPNEQIYWAARVPIHG
jgi:hypothetical protein